MEDDLSGKYVTDLDHEILPMNEFQQQTTNINDKT